MMVGVPAKAYVLRDKDTVDEVVDGLFLSSAYAVSPEAAKRGELRSLRINRVITICDCPLREHQKLEDIDYYFFKADDFLSQDLLHNGIISGAVKLIDEALAAGRRVLVHCSVGMSRSATLVAAFLMKTNRWTRKEAIEFLQAKRSMVCPNEGFQRQLDEFYEKEVVPLRYKQKASEKR